MRFAMSIVAPKERQHLSADALFRLVRSGFAAIPEPCKGDPEMALTDALMSAFAMFSLKSPSLLAFDKQRAEGNLGTIYGIEHVPCDTYMRERLDPVSPESLRPSFQSVFRQLQRGKVLEALVFLDGHYLVALDGTGYFSSSTIHCASCLHKVHRNGAITYYHQMLGAAIIHPDVREVIPLMPEPLRSSQKKTQPLIAMPKVVSQNPPIAVAPVEKRSMRLYWILLAMSALILIIQIWTYFS